MYGYIWRASALLVEFTYVIRNNANVLARKSTLRLDHYGVPTVVTYDYPRSGDHRGKRHQSEKYYEYSLYQEVTSTVFRVPHPLSRRVSSATSRKGRSRVMWINPYKGAIANVSSIPPQPMSGCCASI